MIPFGDELDPAARRTLQAAVDRFGFASFGPGALADALFSDMAAEATAQRSGAWGPVGGKTVDHRNQRANLGPVAQRFLQDSSTLDLLADVLGTALVPSLEASCYTYYDGPGDFLASHLDRPDTCACTLILYLVAAWPEGTEPGPGLELQVFDAADGSASAPPRLRIPTGENVLVIGRGADIPHGRPALRDGERVVALTACYAIADAAATSIDRTSRSAILVEEGHAEYREGNVGAARDRFQAALGIEPTLADAWSGLGFVEWSAGDFREALHMYMAAARHDGADPATWSNIGLCLRDLQAYDRAENAFAVALMLAPDYAPALNEWGNVLQDQGRVADSIALYMRALSLDPTRPVVHHNLGVAYSRLGEQVLAAQAFSTALDRDPGYAHSLEELGLLCIEAGLADEAQAYLMKAGTARASSILESCVRS